VETIRNPFKWGTREHRLLERLILGPILSVEIQRELHILNHNEVLSDPVDRARSHWQHRLVRPGQQPLFDEPRRLSAWEGGRRCCA
jgi:hypothetical protein